MTDKEKPSIQRFFDANESADVLGVSRSFFDDHVRPLLNASYDFTPPGAKKPLPRFSLDDLNDWAAARRRDKKSA